jgi:activator of HSP90 ATPase
MSGQNFQAYRTSVVTRRQMIIGTAAAFGGVALVSVAGWADETGVSHSCAEIHQEVVFKAGLKRVYGALIDSKQFTKVIELSAAAKSGAPLGNKPTAISQEVGGPFTLFGGYITGLQVELLADQRIVQAWRAGSWDPGIYSIAKFDLKEQGLNTKLVFDHTGFPQDQAQHLATGWQINYWEPLAKFLG